MVFSSVKEIIFVELYHICEYNYCTQQNKI